MPAVDELREADAVGRRLVDTGAFDRWGRLAQVRLRLLLLLRILDGGRDRPDSERLADAILDLDPGPVPHSTEVSYLRWYQAITRADVGDTDRSLHVAVQAFRACLALQYQHSHTRDATQPRSRAAL